MGKAIRVLWFTNTPSLASGRLGVKNYMGGWISSLEMEIAKFLDIKLGIAFPFEASKRNDFMIGSTRYFPIPITLEGGKVAGILKRWRHQIEPSDEVLVYENIVNEFHPDIIHVFGSERSFGLIGSVSNKPMILQIQGNLSVYTEKWFSGVTYWDVIRYCKRKPFLQGFGIYHSYYLFRKRAIREREILKQCKYIIGRTDWDRRISSILSPESRYFQCEELLRPPFYNNQWKYIEREGKTLITTISPVTYKGLETILRSANLLKNTGKVKFKWNLVGVNGKEEIVRISEGVTNLRFSDNNIIFKGAVNPDQLIDFLLESDCYVHPSHIENSPNSVCEAMILGVPVIATYAGGTSSIVNDGFEGTLIQDGDSYALAGAILELVTSPERMMLFSKNARKRAIGRHNPETVIRTVLEIYQTVLEST